MMVIAAICTMFSRLWKKWGFLFIVYVTTGAIVDGNLNWYDLFINLLFLNKNLNLHINISDSEIYQFDYKL